MIRVYVRQLKLTVIVYADDVSERMITYQYIQNRYRQLQNLTTNTTQLQTYKSLTFRQRWYFNGHFNYKSPTKTVQQPELQPISLV